MKTSNNTLWTTVEGMANEYTNTTDEIKKDSIMSDLFFAMSDYMSTCVRNAVNSANNYGLDIPKEDFESRYNQYLWEALEAYEKGGSTFKNIVMRRFDFAQKHTWRQYKSKGTSEDKDGVSYESARMDSLDREFGSSEGEGQKTMADVVLGDVESAEEEFIDTTEETLIIDAFEIVNPRYANVIRFMAKGYDGDDLAIATGEGEAYGTKMRKLVQRAKKAFAEYMQ